MKAKEAIEYLKNNLVFFSKLGFYHAPVILQENGMPLVFYTEEEAEEYCKTIDNFCDSGVKLVTSILFEGWLAPNVYDYRETDNVLNKIFKSGKVDYYLPRIKLNVGVDWCLENPEDVCVYYQGPRDPERIKELVGTLKHDYFGYNSPSGYYTAGAKKNYERPNVDGVISLQSFSSDKWLKDAGEALKRLIVHLENGPYADKIIGYHISFGTSGETMPWGRMTRSFGDYSLKNQKKFYEWGINKYGSEEMLKKVWGDISKDIVPPPSVREVLTEDCHTFRSIDKDRWAMDYEDFVVDLNYNALAHFGKIVKDNTDGKAVGAFYGYVLHMCRAGYAGHIGWKKMLKNPYVDFFAAPKSYNRCEPGEAGGELAPAVSVNREKLWLDECDNRTHITTGDNIGNATTLDETITVHLREFSKNLSHDSGLWFMDLGGGWFDDDGIMQNIKKIAKANERLRKKKHKSIAEILSVFDENGAKLTESEYIEKEETCMRELQLAGAPIDTVFLTDLEKLDLTKVKLIVLQNPFALNKEDLKKIKALAPQAKILWLGKGDGCAKLLEGVAVLPVTAGVKEWIKVVKDAGVMRYTNGLCSVYADNRIIGIFPKHDVTVEFFTDKKLKNLVTGEEYSGKISKQVKAKSCIVFECE